MMCGKIVTYGNFGGRLTVQQNRECQ